MDDFHRILRSVTDADDPEETLDRLLAAALDASITSEQFRLLVLHALSMY